MKKPRDSIASILIGDTLGELVKRLATESGGELDGTEKLIVIMITDNGVLVSNSNTVSRVEMCGALQIAYDLVLNK